MSNQYSKRSREYLSAEFVGRLRAVGQKSEALAEERLRPHGLSASQGLLFGLIADQGLKGVAPLQKDLEKDMRLVASSITNLVQGLESKGFIRRTDSSADGRAKELHLTDKGWKLREELGRQATEWKVSLTGALTDEELAALVRLLGKLDDGDD